MKHVFGLWMVLMFFCATPVVTQAGDCDCPSESCGPCKDQVSIEFYTDKCPDGKKIRSCKRPICTDKDPLPETCHASNGPNPTTSPVDATPKLESSKATMKHVGVVVSSFGEASITHPDGEKIAAKAAVNIFEGDLILTGSDAKVAIKLQNENMIHVVPNSKAVIKFYETNDTVHKTLIDLVYGTIRNTVHKAPKDAKNDFKVKTPSAVAGVRGTDFVTTYTDKVGITKVETLTGVVELTSPSGKHKVNIPQGKYASYVIPTHGGIQDEDIDKFVERGYMTDAQSLSEQDIAKIENDTDAERPKQLASRKSQAICNEPQGKLNQCAWTCVGNPGEATTCRTDLPSVKCIRKRCNANGAWAEETRLPSSSSEACEGSKTVVGPCDY